MALPGIPGIPGNFPSLCCLLALAIPVFPALECGEHQYLFHGKCCSDCAPGERMRSRCTAVADTVCIPCQEEYFSSQHHHGFCHSCTVCNSRKGSEEVKKCEKSSDRLCACRAGFMPAGIPLGSECSRCPEGTFSRGRNENCQPWTNCSRFGKSTIRAGTGTEDALCDVPARGTSPRPHPFPTEFPENSSREIPSSPREIPSLCLDPSSPTEPSWGSLSLLLLCLVLLLVSGISILLLIFQAARKETGKGPGRSTQHSGSSCRIPIQEEQADCNSSLTKN